MMMSEQSTGTLSYTASDDLYSGTPGSETLAVTAASGGSFESLVTTDNAVVTINDDTDTTTLTLSDPSVTEEGTATITATLGANTASDLTLTLTGGPFYRGLGHGTDPAVDRA